MLVGRRLVDVVPVLLQARPRPTVSTGSSCVDARLLRHRVDELGVHEEQAVDLAFAVRVEHDLDRADQVLHVRLVAEAGDAGQHRQVQAAEERRALAADQAQAHARALVLPLLHQRPAPA